MKINACDISGCCTFWEDCGPLAALVSHHMGLTGTGVSGAIIAKTKSLTQNFLLKRTDDIPHFPRTYLYASNSHHIKSTDDIANGMKQVGSPAVLKLEYGSSAVAVHVVDNADECKKCYAHVKETLKEENNHPGIGLGHGNSMMLMPYLEGTEHDIDIIILKRQLVAAFISDNGPTRRGQLTETTASMPSCLESDKQAQIITAAYQCATEIGLTDGVFNIEMMMTITGPKLIEINGRMGGFYLRDWIKTCYHVDLISCALMVCSGIKPYIPKIEPSCHIMGVMCIPSEHSSIFNDNQTIAKIASLIDIKLILYTPIEVEFDHQVTSCTHEEPICNIAVIGENIHDARSKLLKTCSLLDITTHTYNVPYLVSGFNCIENKSQFGD